MAEKASPDTIVPTISREYTHEEKGSIRYPNRAGAEIDLTTVQPGSDEIYERKVAILNEAILDIGMGYYQWWTFVLTGFGWFVDNASIRLSQPV